MGEIMKKIVALTVLICVISALCGCGRLYPALPENAEVFSLGSFTYGAEDDAGYGVIVYGGREYMPYGTLAGRLRAGDVAACVGYVLHEGAEEDTAMRVYTLSADPAGDYVMVRFEDDVEMGPPSFWRAADTRGEEVHTPAFIEPPAEGFWAQP